MKHISKNLWTSKYEQEQYPCLLEWWCTQAFFKTIENSKEWSFKISFSQWNDKGKSGSILHSSLLDKGKNRQYNYYSRNDENKLESKENTYNMKYEDSYIKGSYPIYETYFIDDKNKVKLYLKYEAESLPYQLFQDLTGGVIPMGLGYYKYGYIPKCKISGRLTINNNNYNVSGKGYFEHVWGDFLYDKPLEFALKFKKLLSAYVKLAKWRVKSINVKIPNSIKFSTDNNPLSYDWAWAVFDQGWNIFYGNALFWIMEGPTIGILILSKNDETYTEFSDIHFKYNKTRYSKVYDVYYPSDFEIKAKKEKEELRLHFCMTADTREYIARFEKSGLWHGFVICEAPGSVEGCYSDGKEKIILKGDCKIESQRQASVFGHNSLKIDFLKPPGGFGINFDFESHYFRKKIFSKFQLLPKPIIKINFGRINKPIIMNPIKKNYKKQS